MTRKPPKDGKPKGNAKAAKAALGLTVEPAPKTPWPDEPPGTDPASFPIPNPKQERFCQAVASGASLHDAYVEAGYRGTPANARRLRNDEAVWERIEWLQTEIGRRVIETAVTAITALGYTRDDAMREAEEARKLCIGLGQGAAAVAATKLKAEIAGVPMGQTTAPPSTDDEVVARTTEDPKVVEQIEAHKRARALLKVVGGRDQKGKAK